MKTKLGIHIGMQESIPMSDGQVLAMMRSSLLWQEYNGPIIIFVDEPFYTWMYENDMEQLYQDIVPVDEGMNTAEVVNRILSNAAYDSIFIINLDDFSLPEGSGEVFSVRKSLEQKDFVDLHLELLPNEYKKLWQQVRQHPIQRA